MWLLVCDGVLVCLCTAAVLCGLVDVFVICCAWVVCVACIGLC